VIGGGVTGCSCALTLAERGLRVRVYEAHEVGAGASGRNGGFVLGGAAMAYDHARLAFGVEGARLLWQLADRSLERLARLAGDTFRPVGSVRLAATPAEHDELVAELDLLREDGFERTWLAALPTRLDALFCAALVNHGDGALDPARWVRRLAQRAADAGAEIVEHVSVDPGTLDAPAIVIATDGLTGAVVPVLAPFVVPIRGQMLATEPLPERLYGRPHYARHGYDYWQQLPGGVLLIGGKRDAGFEAEQTAVDATTPEIQSRLEQLVVDLVGRLPPVTHRWAGIWGETPDRLPLVGRIPKLDGFWVAGGYSGHGNVLGLACGDLVARAILGEKPAELDLFAPTRFSNDGHPRGPASRT
jgi:glycine/D-amino acid oxidase-like deaminating enzyme